MSETPQAAPAATTEGQKNDVFKPGYFSVVKPDCIACDACAVEFTDLFFMMDWQGERKAEATPNKERSANDTDVWKIIKICPTGAIKFDGDLPPEPSEEVHLEVVEGWEEAWRQAQRRGRGPDTADERNRRYGLVREVLDFEDRTVVRIHMPMRVPDIDLKFKYGLPDEMPDYTYQVELVSPTQLRVKCSITEEKVKSLCYKANAFPEQFYVNLTLPAPVSSFKERYTEYVIQVVLFKSPKDAEEHVWPSHYITDRCTGCLICLSKCPTSAITGDRERRHFINEELCINCRACGTYCPFHAIDDERGATVEYVKPKEVAKAEVIDELCTGCSFCVDVCPTDCITLIPEPGGVPGSPIHIVARVDERRCISCKICEHVCIKDAIIVEREVPFTPGIGWSFQYPANEESRIVGSFSSQLSADAPSMLALLEQKQAGEKPEGDKE